MAARLWRPDARADLREPEIHDYTLRAVLITVIPRCRVAGQP